MPSAIITIRELLAPYQPGSTEHPKGRLMTAHDWKMITTALRVVEKSASKASGDATGETTIDLQVSAQVRIGG